MWQRQSPLFAETLVNSGALNSCMKINRWIFLPVSSEHTPMLVQPTQCGSSEYMRWTYAPLKTQTPQSLLVAAEHRVRADTSVSPAPELLSLSPIPGSRSPPHHSYCLSRLPSHSQRASASLLLGEMLLGYAWFKKSGLLSSYLATP